MPAIGMSGRAAATATRASAAGIAAHSAPPAPARSFLGNIGASLAHVAPVVQHAIQSTATPHRGTLAQAISRPAPAHSGNLFGRTTPHPLTRRSVPTSSTPQQNAQVAQQLRNEFVQFQKEGRIPATAKFPALSFDAMQPSGSGASKGGVEAYVTPDRAIHLPPGIGAMAANRRDPLWRFSQQAPIHELAHTMQSSGALSDVGLREGSAQAWADRMSPVRSGDGNYSQFVQRVRTLEPRTWIGGGAPGTGDQFNPAVPAPTISMPTSKPGAGAITQLGARIAGHIKGVGMMPQLNQSAQVWDPALGGLVPLSRWEAARKKSGRV